jgi:hypothetical protein
MPPITGLTIWLDASKGITMSGGAVTAWADQSGSGEDATAAAGTAPSLSANAVGNHDALHFTFSSNTALTVAAATGTDWESGPFLLELVLRETTAASTPALFWLTGDPTGRPRVALYNQQMSTVGDFALSAGSVSTSVFMDSGSTVAYNDGSLHSVGVWRDSAGNISLLIDGVAIGTQALSGALSTAGGAKVGSFDGDLLEVLGKNGAVTSTDVAAVETYFQTKYGTP